MMELATFIFGLLLLLAPIGIWVYAARIYAVLQRIEENQEKLLKSEEKGSERDN